MIKMMTLIRKSVIIWIAPFVVYQCNQSNHYYGFLEKISEQQDSQFAARGNIRVPAEKAINLPCAMDVTSNADDSLTITITNLINLIIPNALFGGYENGKEKLPKGHYTLEATRKIYAVQ
jgi:hypothetical protein